MVRFWDAETVKVQQTFNVGDYAFRLLFTSNQRLVVASGASIRIWDVSTASLLQSLRPQEDDYFRDMDYSPDENHPVASNRGIVVLYNVSPSPNVAEWTKVVLNPEKNAGYGAQCVRFSPGGALIAYTQGSSIFLCDVKSRKTSRILDGHEWTIDGLAFWHNSQSNSTYLASASDDGTVRIWETSGEMDEALYALEGHSDYVNCVAISSNGMRLASGSSDFTIRLWVWKGWSDGSREKPFHELEMVLYGHDSITFSLSFSPNHQQLILTSSDSIARV